jgi:hypothetical protein
MTREVLKLHSQPFTTVSALVREIGHLLEDSSYKIELHVPAALVEHLEAEIGGWVTLGRLKVVVE